MAGLSKYPATATLRAEDFKRAAKFYTEVLGLEQVPMSEGDGVGIFRAGDGSMISIYERKGMPAPQNTTLTFVIPADEFDSALADLRSRGVVFEDYDIPEIGLKTQNGVAVMGTSKSAWFKDSEENILLIGTE